MKRVVVVTGAARGIGRGLAERLLDEGYRVAALDVNDEGLQSLSRSTANAAHLMTLWCDVSREEDVSRAVEQVVTCHGRIHGLVNNAAIAEPTNPPLSNFEFSAWRRILATNLDSVFLCSKASAPALRSARGAIVNIASTRALQSEPNSEGYAAAKGAVLALTHALAVSLGPEVRVNAISPGWIDTSGKPDALSRKDHAQHPVGRVGRVADVSELTLFLLSDRAGFITGQNFVLDGGMTRKMIYAE